MHIIINFLIKCRFTEFEERKEIGRSDVFSLLITFLQNPVDQFRAFFLNSLLKSPVFPEIKKFLPLNPGLLCFGCNGEGVSATDENVNILAILTLLCSVIYSHNCVYIY